MPLPTLIFFFVRSKAAGQPEKTAFSYDQQRTEKHSKSRAQKNTAPAFSHQNASSDSARCSFSPLQKKSDHLLQVSRSTPSFEYRSFSPTPKPIILGAICFHDLKDTICQLCITQTHVERPPWIIQRIYFYSASVLPITIAVARKPILYVPQSRSHPSVLI
jgi:hypothetical protein